MAKLQLNYILILSMGLLTSYLSDSRLNYYSLDYFLKIHECYVNVLNNMDPIRIGCPNY